MLHEPNRLRGLFQAAVQFAPAGRALYLAAECPDPEQRRRVQELLDAHDRAGDFLEHAPCPPAPALRPGGRCGPYTLVRVIGEGGMGTVWNAEQLEPLLRSVALKVVRPGLGSPAVIARFDAERRALALMSHPNVARVLDAGTTDAGQPYFAMELVDGVPVTTFCATQRLDARQKLGVFLDVCRGVQHAHQKGVIHRDIKPSNVLVAVCDGRPVPKVIDFGIAKALRDAPSGEWPLTGYGAVVGTPAYMSPEQARPGECDPDTRSDVFSLGVLLYELLTGTTPHGRAAGIDVVEALRRVREDDPPPPSSRARELPGDLDWVVMKALEKDPERRYESVAALARDVENFLADEPVSARPPSRAYRLKKFVRKNRGAVAAASLVLLALLGGIAGTTAGMLKARAAEREAVAARAAESEQLQQTQVQRDLAEANAAAARKAQAAAAESEATARDVLQFVLDRVFAAGRPVGIAGGLGHDVTLRKAVEAAEPWITESFAGRPLVAARVREVLGSSSQSLGNHRRAKELHETVFETRLGLLGADHPDTIAAMNNLAESHRGLGDPDAAIRLLEQARGLARPGTDTLPLRNNLGHAYCARGRFADAIELFEPALAESRAALGENHWRTLTTQNNLGEAYRRAKRFGDAERSLADALTRCRTALIPDHPLTLAVENNVADLHLIAGRFAEAAAGFRAVIPRAAARMGDDHPHVLATMFNLGEALTQLGRANEAADWHEKALAGRRKALPKGNWDVMRSIAATTEAYIAAGRYDAAGRLTRDCLAELRSRRSKPSDLAADLAQLGDAFTRAEQFDDAEAVLRESLAIWEKIAPGGLPVFNLRAMLGAALLGAGKFTEAEPHVLAGYEGLKAREASIPPAGRKWLAAAGRRVVELYERTDRPDEARRWRAALGLPQSEPAPAPRAK